MRKLQKQIIERSVQAVILRMHAPRLNVSRNFRHVEDRREIQLLRLPVLDGLPRIQFIAAAHHFVHRPEPKLRHEFANFFSNHAEVIDDVLRFAGELLAKHRILSRHADRARVQMADAHHDAARHD